VLRKLISASALLKWYDVNKSDYPWGRSAYQVWVSEIMLQQTVAATVVPYYLKWMVRYPDIESLASARDDDVVGLWEGLGYYNRVRNMLKTARILSESCYGNFPQNYIDLLKLPGIGDYTARAIISLAFSKPYPVMDANVFRVAQRLTGIKERTRLFEKELLDGLSQIIPSDRCGDFNEALMQFGQQVCSSQSPTCSLCPFNKNCFALKNKLTAYIPQKVKSEKKKFKTFIPVLFWEDRFLIAKIGKGPGKDLYVFPGTPESEKNEIINNLNVTPEKIGQFMHHYTINQEYLFVYFFTMKKDPCFPPYYENRQYAFKWVSEKDLPHYPMPSVYRRILRKFPKLPIVLGSYKG